MEEPDCRHVCFLHILEVSFPWDLQKELLYTLLDQWILFNLISKYKLNKKKNY